MSAYREFLELFNLSSQSIDISNWYLTDAVTTRHVFGSGSLIDANSALVIFGGGSPSLTGINWQVASKGSLNLNNSGDTITLFGLNDEIIDFVTYGAEAGYNQSIVRNPEGSKGNWIKHTTLPNADGKRFSPGYLVNEVGVIEVADYSEQNTVPEPATILYLTFGLGGMFLVRKKQ